MEGLFECPEVLGSRWLSRWAMCVSNHKWCQWDSSHYHHLKCNCVMKIRLAQASKLGRVLCNHIHQICSPCLSLVSTSCELLFSPFTMFFFYMVRDPSSPPHLDLMLATGSAQPPHTNLVNKELWHCCSTFFSQFLHVSLKLDLFCSKSAATV